jgi:signal transduction histidine kinase
MPASTEHPPLPAAAGLALTGEALVHLRAMARAVVGSAARLERRLLRELARRGYDAPRRKALAALSPAAAAALLAARKPIGRFLEAVAYHGRRLARLNVRPDEVVDALRLADRLLEEVAGERFRPAREHLHLATILAVNNAFYDVREGEAQAFFGLAEAEAEARDVGDLLHRFSGVLAQAFRARAAGLYLLDEVPAARRRPRYLSGRARPLDARLEAAGDCWWSFPIPAGKQVAGLVELAFPGRYPWLPREAQLLRAAAEGCGRAIERATLVEQVVRLAAAARRAEEEERRRLGRELHDETAQSLLVLRLQMEMLERETVGEVQARIAGLRESVERNVNDLRRIIAALSPAMLERLGLEAAVRQLAERFGKRFAGRLTVRISSSGRPVPAEASEAVYRIAQESLHNVFRHSQAVSVNLLLRIADRVVKLSVVDDGVGFDADVASNRPMSFGLLGMRERAALIGGTLRIRSAPGKGTAVVLEVPRASAETVTHGKDSNFPHR